MSTETTPGEIEDLKSLLPFLEIARQIPSSRNGKPVHVATIGRWREPGVRAKNGSRIKLRCVRFPGGWRTTVEWVRQFLDAVTLDRSGEAAPTPAPIRLSARRRREIERAKRELAEAGY